MPSLAEVGVLSSVPRELPAAGRLRLGDVDLGAGRPAVVRGSTAVAGQEQEPTLWATDREIPGAATAWRQSVDRFRDTGLWPLVLTALGGGHPSRPWDSGELRPVPLENVDELDPTEVLAEGWADSLVPMGPDPYVEHLRPFGAQFPGLSMPLRRAGVPIEAPVDAIAPGPWARIGLVPCRRPADAIAAIGWHGAINSRSPAQVSAVLRSWEERFGTVLAGLGFATLTLLIPDPPRAESEALPIAAEVAALCPDVLAEVASTKVVCDGSVISGPPT